MTRIDRSPEQLSAEAAAPQRNLADTILLHRALAARDLWISRMTTTAPPVFTDKNGGRSSDPMSQLGPTLSWPLTAFISYKIEDGEMVETPAQSFPWSVGLASVRHHCRRDHTTHWDQEVWNGSACHAIVSAVVRRGMQLERACFETGLSLSLGTDLLTKAFARIENKLKELQVKATEVVKSDEGRNDWQSLPHEHRAVPGVHADECQNPICRSLRVA